DFIWRISVQASFGAAGRSPSRQALWSNRNDHQRDAPCGSHRAFDLHCVAGACTGTKPAQEQFATLEQPAVFEIAANTGSLKETVQKGQQLVWRPKGGPSDGGFRVTNISVAFLRSESGGQVKMTFSGNVSSLGYLTSEEAKLNVIVRAKGGASLHSWSFGISV